MLSVLHYMEMILDDRYLLRRYINCPDDKLSRAAWRYARTIGGLSASGTEFESVLQVRQKPVAEG